MAARPAVAAASSPGGPASARADLIWPQCRLRAKPEDVYSALKEHRQPDPAAYTRRLSELPGDWPPPETAR